MMKIILENKLMDIFKLLDPVRFYESLLFFEQDVRRLIFGSGFGAGLIDTKGYFSFVAYDDTAFSRKELQSNMYYNFHDVWVDIGTRFGLASLILISIWIVYLGYVTKKYFVVGIVFMSIITGFFSFSGLLCSAMLILSLSSSRYV